MAIAHLLLIRIVLLLSTICVISDRFDTVKAQMDIGVNYEMQGDNLPSATEVINLYKQNDKGKIRLFDPDQSTLRALRGSRISVTLDVRNQDLPALASNRSAVQHWFARNVQLYLNDFEFWYLVVKTRLSLGT
ncbi:Glycoside hydrolase [Trema orientale]|uniref:glucan endo-1,3-beta-D-glucosidase n=1 Tax=Trema orientale TaxID=63057 RepID=A0A2P5C3H3_TREOI|nr:Glycoside hydrolase [Trema orientale]